MIVKLVVGAVIVPVMKMYFHIFRHVEATPPTFSLLALEYFGSESAFISPVIPLYPIFPVSVVGRFLTFDVDVSVDFVSWLRESYS